MQSLVDNLNTWLKKHPGIILAILFGSFARDQQRSDSDVDIAIAGENKLSANQRLKLTQELITLLKRDVDLIDLNTIGQPLLGRIIAEGLLIKNTENAYTDLAIRNVNMNEDFLPLIERTQKERRDKFLNG